MQNQYYDELLPYALKCGMTADEFWNSEPRLFSSYIKKNQLQLDEINYQAWLFGLYEYKAICTALGNAFSDKGSTENTYFEKPLEELTHNYEEKLSKKKETFDDEVREVHNYWAKFGKKGKKGV